MEKTYKRSYLSFLSFNPFNWINPKYYIDLFTFFKNYVVLTEDAVVLKKGLVRVQTTSIPLNKINSVKVKQGFFGRLYSFGDVIILSGNDLIGETIKGVMHADNLKVDIEERIRNKENKNSYQYQPTGRQEGKRDNLDQLEKLAELKEKGIISESEFAAKKKKLLGI